MQDRNQTCSSCKSVVSIQGCVCDEEVKLLCSKCFSDHFTDSVKDHNPVELDLALRMLADPSLINLYLDERVQIFTFLKDLRETLKKSQEVKKQYSERKQRLISHMETIYNEFYREAEEFARDTTEKIKNINNYKVSLSEEGKALIQKYREVGVQGLLQNNTLSKDFLTDEIVKYMFNTIDMKLSNGEKSSIIAYKDQFTDLIKSEKADKDKEYYSLRDNCKEHPAKKEPYIPELRSNTKIVNQIFQKSTNIEDPRLKLEMNDIKHAKLPSVLDIKSEELEFRAERQDHKKESHISNLDAQIEELKSDLRQRNSEHKYRVSVKEREIIALEFYFRIAIYSLFAFALGMQVAVAYLFSVIIFVWILWDKFIGYIIKRKASSRRTNIDADKEKVESSLKVEDNECMNKYNKIYELLSDIEIIDAEYEDLVFLKNRQVIETGLHYGLAIIIAVSFKFYLDEVWLHLSRVVYILIIVKVGYMITSYLFQGKVLRRETSIYSIKEDLESLLKMEDTECNNLAVKLGELKLELKIKDAEHENHVSLRNRQITALQRILAAATFFISMYGLSKNSFIAMFHINLIINWVSAQNKLSQAINMYWKELRQIICNKLRL